MKCKHCGSEEFIGHQIVRMDVLVDGDGDYTNGVHKDIAHDIYDAEKPYGPFQCCGCGAEYDELKEDAQPVFGPISGWTFHEETTNQEATLIDTLSEDEKEKVLQLVRDLHQKDLSNGSSLGRHSGLYEVAAEAIESLLKQKVR